jgi:hypothetical protein
MLRCLKEKGTRTQEKGTRTQEKETRTQEKGTRTQEKETRTQEKGTRTTSKTRPKPDHRKWATLIQGLDAPSWDIPP